MQEYKPVRGYRALMRPHCHGLFIQDDTLYAQRYATHPDYRALVTLEEQRAYLRPVPIPLRNVRVFVDVAGDHPHTAAVGVEIGPFIPILPVSFGKKAVELSVHTADNVVYKGWAKQGGGALRLYRKIGKLIEAVNRADGS
ncbi:hypothetical protein [Nocardia terpenica]|uniref:Uncharacterized protein n=1 Tax=Nocardia terpenica TaxID=455432 RepID=A0A6G9YWL6_9NOCA|nr:hypothetical protein [Nocardia terpenica]QIS17618.1 hypothetical protein F6W96_04170 [Nocardia terpenica]